MYENHSIMTATQQYADKNRLYAKKKLVVCKKNKKTSFACEMTAIGRRTNI